MSPKIPKTKHESTTTMNREDNMIPLKEHNTSILEYENKEIEAMSEKRFKRITIRLLKKHRGTNT